MCCARDADKTRMTVLTLYTSCKIREHSKLKEHYKSNGQGKNIEKHVMFVLRFHKGTCVSAKFINKHAKEMRYISL